MSLNARLKSSQETFWEGPFGEQYTERNAVQVEERVPFFQKIMALTEGVQSVCELGANVGHNLMAIARCRPETRVVGVEINPVACQQMVAIPTIEAHCLALLDFEPAETFDLVFTCGVLIHQNPKDLPAVYDRMLALSARYLLINEYFNPIPQEIPYRGHSERLFKRDFAGELMDRHPGAWRLVEAGFLWKRQNPGWDNTTWFLLEKGDAAKCDGANNAFSKVSSGEMMGS